MAASQLWGMIRRREGIYGVVGVPYASPESRRVCEEMDVGLLDMAGNCYLRFGGVYVSVEGKENRWAATRPLRQPFGRVSSRGVRAILCESVREWRAGDLAVSAGISVGLAYNLLRRLGEMELMTPPGQRGQGFRMEKPIRLLRAWAASYSFRRNQARDFYSTDDLGACEEKLARFCEKEQVRYAFTLTSGAARLAAALRYTRAFAYLERGWEDAARALGWKAVASGPNVTLLQPYDDGVFYKVLRVGGVNVACAPQLYVDLLSYKGRGEDAAEAVLDQVLRKQWPSGE
jgi:hypothetical protein